MTIQTEDAKWLEQMMKAVRGVTHGHAHIVNQRPRVIQIRTLEKRPLTQ
jgi:hypothetical protein